MERTASGALMARQLPLAMGYEVRSEPRRRGRDWWSDRAGEGNGYDASPDPDSFLGEVRPVLRVAGMMAAIALAGFAAVVGTMLALMSAP